MSHKFSHQLIQDKQDVHSLLSKRLPLSSDAVLPRPALQWHSELDCAPHVTLRPQFLSLIVLGNVSGYSVLHAETFFSPIARYRSPFKLRAVWQKPTTLAKCGLAFFAHPSKNITEKSEPWRFLTMFSYTSKQI